MGHYQQSSEAPRKADIKTVNKAFKSDSQRLAVSLRSSIAKRRSHLNAALWLPPIMILVR
ncbi:hypothetical protein DC357_22455 [Vibrio vulnificus]|nr:hypothetical protein DC357_22455 [Vibrio vulnificus]